MQHKKDYFNKKNIHVFLFNFFHVIFFCFDCVEKEKEKKQLCRATFFIYLDSKMSFMAENWHISCDDKDLLSLPLTLPFIIAQMAKLILDKRSSLVYFDISELGRWLQLKNKKKTPVRNFKEFFC